MRLVICSGSRTQDFSTVAAFDVEPARCLDEVRQLLPSLRTGVMIALWHGFGANDSWHCFTEDVREVTFPLASEALAS